VDASIARYLDFLTHARRLAALTVKHYGRGLALLVRLAEAAGRPLDRLSQADVRRFAAALHGRGLGAKSLARVLSGWRGYYEFRVRNQQSASNPVDGVRAPKAPRRLPQTLSPDQAVALVSFTDETPEGIRDRAIYELLYSSGLRVSEVTGLDLGSIDFSTAEVRVTGKGSKTRIVPVGRHAIEAVSRWLPVRESLHPSDHAALFVTARGKRKGPRTVKRHIKL